MTTNTQTIKKFEHVFEVNAPLHEVASFHFDATNMKKLTPPGTFIRFESVPDDMADGEQVAFRMMMGPVPVRWVAEFSDVGPTGFVDSQREGPFQKWEHTHRFEAIDENRTRVIDSIEVVFKTGTDRVIGELMFRTLPVLFAYRKAQTRRLLSSG